MEEKAISTHTTGLIYGLNDRPPVREAIFAAIQHLLAIFVAIITPPLIIAGALKLDLETTSFLVSMASLPSSNANALGVSEQDCYAFKEPAFLLSVPLFQPVCWEGSH